MAYIPDGTGALATVGAIQSLSVTESSAMKRIGETRNPRTFEIIPQGQDVISLNIRRIVFDGLRLTHALGCGFSHIRSQRWPFDIIVFDREHDGATFNANQTWYRRCWLTNYTVDYRAENYLITENASLECEYAQELYPVSSEDNERGLKLRIDGGKLEYSYDEALELGAVKTAKPPSIPASTSMNQSVGEPFTAPPVKPQPAPAPPAAPTDTPAKTPSQTGVTVTEYAGATEITVYPAGPPPTTTGSTILAGPGTNPNNDRTVTPIGHG